MSFSFCPECGARLEPGDKFCLNCGVRISDYDDSVAAGKAQITRGEEDTLHTNPSGYPEYAGYSGYHKDTEYLENPYGSVRRETTSPLLPPKPQIVQGQRTSRELGAQRPKREDTQRGGKHRAKQSRRDFGNDDGYARKQPGKGRRAVRILAPILMVSAFFVGGVYIVGRTVFRNKSSASNASGNTSSAQDLAAVEAQAEPQNQASNQTQAQTQDQAQEQNQAQAQTQAQEQNQGQAQTQAQEQNQGQAQTQAQEQNQSQAQTQAEQFVKVDSNALAEAEKTINQLRNEIDTLEEENSQLKETRETEALNYAVTYSGDRSQGIYIGKPYTSLHGFSVSLPENWEVIETHRSTEDGVEYAVKGSSASVYIYVGRPDYECSIEGIYDYVSSLEACANVVYGKCNEADVVVFDEPGMSRSIAFPDAYGFVDQITVYAADSTVRSEYSYDVFCSLFINSSTG